MNITLSGLSSANGAQAAQSSPSATFSPPSKSSVYTNAYTVNLSSGKSESAGEAPTVNGKDGDNDGH